MCCSGEMADCLRHSSASFAESCAPAPTMQVGLHATSIADATKPVGSAHPFIGYCALQYPVLIDLSNSLSNNFSITSTPNHSMPATLCFRTRIHRTLMALIRGTLSTPSLSSSRAILRSAAASHLNTSGDHYSPFFYVQPRAI